MESVVPVNSPISASPRGWQVIAIDLDGTLLDRQHRLHPEDIAAVQEARDAGLHVAICTGRTSLESQAVARALELTGPGIFVNGSTIADMATGQSLFCHMIPKPLAEEIVDFWGSRGHAVLVLADDAESGLPVYIRTCHAAPHPATVDWLIVNKMKALIQERIEPRYLDRIVRLGIVVDVKDALAMERALVKHFGERIFSYSIYAAVYDCQVIEAFGRRVTKWSGIQKLCQHLGVDSLRAVAIGDDVNDIPMLEEASLSFAMASANDLVKSKAKRLTNPQNEGGVAMAIRGILNGKW